MRFVIEGHRHLMTIITAFTLIFFSGCGSGYDENQILDPLELVRNFDANPPQHHPEEFVEISLTLGPINTQVQPPGSAETITIKFEVHIVVPRTSKVDIEKTVASRRGRILDAVVEAISQSDLTALSDPDLTWVKTRLISAVNDELKSDEVRDVVFSYFSLLAG